MNLSKLDIIGITITGIVLTIYIIVLYKEYMLFKEER